MRAHGQCFVYTGMVYGISLRTALPHPDPVPPPDCDCKEGVIASLTGTWTNPPP